MVENPKVNYITHLNDFFDKIANDERINPYHAMLYISLFQFWNINRFQNPISIARSEVMKISKIGSANTYTKYLKELHEFGYLKYVPSYNPIKGSLVYLYTFDKGSDKGTDKGSSKGTDKGSDKGGATLYKHNKQLNIKTDKQESKPSSPQKKDEIKKKKIPPELDEVEIYFLEKGNSKTEASRFFNYFQSNGWLVGGRAKMKNWKAAANNWMMRSKEYASNSRATNTNLNVKQNKDYDIPL